MRESALNKLQFIAYAIATVLVVSLMVYLAAYDNTQIWRSEVRPEFIEITRVETSRVEDETAPVGVATHYKFTLDESMEYDTTLMFYTCHNDVSVYVDGEQVYNVTAAENLPSIKTPAGVWNRIPVSSEDAGKEILVVMYPSYEDYSISVRFLLGSPMEIYRHELSTASTAIFLCAANVFVGFMMVLYGIYTFFRTKGAQNNTFALGTLAICVGLWRFTYTNFCYFVIESRPVFTYYISLVSLGMIGATLLLATRVNIDNLWNRIRTVVCIAMSIIISVQIIIQWAGIMELRESLTLVHGMLLCSGMILLVERLAMIVLRRKPEYAKIRLDCAWMIAVGLIVDMLFFLLARSSSGLLFTLIAILIYVVIEGVYVVRYNVLEKRRLFNRLDILSTHDTLTGLLNRNQYMMEIHRLETQYAGGLGFILLDINGLSNINKTYGLQYGDNVLRRIADILKERYDDNVYRIGGDEFAIFCTDMSKEEFQQHTVSLRALLDEEKTCNISMGFGWSEDSSIDVNEQRDKAWEMCRAVKQSYYHKSSAGGDITTASGYAGEILKQIADGAFTVHYQPQMDIETGKIIGAEALVRKKAEDGTLIPPGSFIPFYEVSGVISHVDLFVLRTACRALRKWKEQGYDLRISVNFSRVTLLEENIVDVITEICRENRVSPSSINVEVTESISKMDQDQLIELSQKLKQNGFTISLDDFGSKYSNLAILSSMEFDEIKFDRSLISTLEENEKSRMLIDAVLQLCRTMGNTLSLAEGIETKGQLNILAEYSCKCGQGYYFSRPLPREEFELFMKENS
ncbi:MAG: bifunctional diguanylate cyclase/phosphodiesterase [Firmicutes bacterium]|nr:bifunctional diguanylate cyclase/phosphodiesterase [Bacillota bacterium]